MPDPSKLFFYKYSRDALQIAHDFMGDGLSRSRHFIDSDFFLSLLAHEDDFIAGTDFVIASDHELVHADAADDRATLAIDEDDALIGKASVPAVRITDRDSRSLHILFGDIGTAIADGFALVQDLDMGDMAHDAHRILEIELVRHDIRWLRPIDDNARTGKVVPASRDINDTGTVGGGDHEVFIDRHVGDRFIEAVELFQCGILLLVVLLSPYG